MAIDITALYCCLDDFCKVFEDWEAHRLIPSQTTRQRTGKLSRSEMLFIMVLFHLSPFKHFKVFYHYGIGHQHRACFHELPHYDRFVCLMPRLFVPFMVCRIAWGVETGIYFVDSTSLLSVTIAASTVTRSSMAWPRAQDQHGMRSFGIKLHFVINHKGQIMALKITPGNTADSTVLDEMTRILPASSTPTKAISVSDLFQHTLAAWPTPHHQYPPQHAELSDASGRQDHAAQTLRYRNRARYPQI